MGKAGGNGGASGRADAYRPCVGVMLLNGEGKAFVGRRNAPGDEARSRYMWQMPQGGIDPGETPLEAAHRELAEETGVRKADVIAEHPDWLSYDFPPEVLAAKPHGRGWIGQRQRWFAMRFSGAEAEIDLTAHGTPEFDAWRWEALEALPDLIIPWKRTVYERVVAQFSPHAAALAERT